MKKKIALILKFALPHKGKFILIFFCILATTFSSALYPYIFGRLVDEVFYKKDVTIFYQIVVAYFFVFVLNQLLHLLQNITWTSLLTQFLFDIKTAVFDKILYYKGEVLDELHSGDIIARMNKDSEGFMNLICWNTFYSISGIINIILSVVFILNYNVWLALFTIVVTPIIVYISMNYSKFIKKYYIDLSKHKGLLTSWLFEIIKCLQEIRLLNASKKIIYDLISRNIKISRLQIESNKIEIVSERVNVGISLISQMILYGLSAFFIFKENLTVGGFTACISYFGTCISAFNILNNRITSAQSSIASIDRIISIFDNESEACCKDEADKEITEGKITFKNVEFKYNNINVLKGVTLEINPYEKIALVGRSGAGKTTIANILCKFYDIDTGEIFIDNQNLNEIKHSYLREKIGIVHQEFFFFDGTLRYNICFERSQNNDNKLYDILKLVDLYKLVISLPNKLDTNITEIALSGGQKQRLAIARVLYKNPSILIFDESTSALDSETELLVKSIWNVICRKKTVIIIAHRLSTIVNSDKIAVLDDGKIIGFDTHSKLVNMCPVYKELFNEQITKSPRCKEEVHV